MRERSIVAEQAGFTLLEMLVVLAILAVVGSAALMLSGRRPAGVDVKSAANMLSAELRLARARAIHTSGETFVAVDVEAREFWNDRQAARQPLRHDLTIDLVTAAPERVSRAVGRVRFFPDGSSTGGSITLNLGAQVSKVSIDWLTGIPKVASQ